MSEFTWPIEIARSPAGPFLELEVLVDTGSTYTWVPRSLLERLEVQPLFPWEFETADGRIIERDVAEVAVRLDGRILTSLVVFGDEGTQPLLGAYTLEGFRLAVDPVNKQLIPVRASLRLLLRCETRGRLSRPSLGWRVM